MEAVTDKLIGDKDFNLRVAFGKTLTDYNDPIKKNGTPIFVSVPGKSASQIPAAVR